MKFFLSILLFFISFASLADAWDNLTYEEAEAVVSELEKNPFIFDYCDCCSHDGEYATSIEFIKVTGTEIVQCEWNNEMYSVKITASVIANVAYMSYGADIQTLKAMDNNDYHTTFYMNYTWGFNPNSKSASPFFNIIEYNYYGSDNTPCKQLFNYPTPKQLKKTVKVKGYKKWWKSNMR
jgi:hypothetical protein